MANEQQREYWNTAAGPRWVENQATMDRSLQEISRVLIEHAAPRPGERVIDVGCGTGATTLAIAERVGPEGSCVGIDISEPMLSRAVSAEAKPNVGFLRADAQQLPFRDETFDAATSLAVLQLIPNPATTLGEIVRVLKPGGRVAIMVPTAGRAAFLKWLPNGGVHFFSEDELGDTFEELGLSGVRTKTIGNIQWVRGRKP